jgi:hypothetical protein
MAGFGVRRYFRHQHEIPDRYSIIMPILHFSNFSGLNATGHTGNQKLKAQVYFLIFEPS